MVGAKNEALSLDQDGGWAINSAGAVNPPASTEAWEVTASGDNYGKAKATTESPRGSSLITRFPPAAITRYCFPFIS